MLISLIFFVIIAFITLIAIKYGKLEILSIVLASVALLPFLMSAYLYFIERPTIHYCIAEKNKSQEGDKYIYDMLFVMSCKKGKVLLNNLFIAHERGVMQAKHPDVRGDIQYCYILEESGALPTFRFNFGERPFYSEKFLISPPPLRFESKEDKEKLILKFIADTKVDPFKLGFWSIFQPNYNYRCFLEIPIDFENLAIQEGDF